MTTSFVTGGSGLVGRALVAALLADGHRVLALVRQPQDGTALAALGAEPVFGDLLEERGTWRPRVGEADLVWHLGLPRLPVPLRPLRVRRLRAASATGARLLAGAMADGQPAVVASTTLVYGDRPGARVGEGDAPQPLGWGQVGHAAERALADGALRVVRLPWVYGPTGFFPGVLRGLRQRRLRIVGDGGNPMPVLAAEDAAAALRAAAAAPAGVYAVAEDPVPTQRGLVEELCAQLGVRRTDVLPLPMAALSMGGALAHAVAASCDLAPGALAAAGWRPARSWRSDLVALCDTDRADGRRPG